MLEYSSHGTWIIGITGGVGAGKSTVLALLEQEYGACVIQADQVGHLVMEPGQPCYKAVIEHFGKEFLAGMPSGMPGKKDDAGTIRMDGEIISAGPACHLKHRLHVFAPIHIEDPGMALGVKQAPFRLFAVVVELVKFLVTHGSKAFRYGKGKGLIHFYLLIGPG